VNNNWAIKLIAEVPPKSCNESIVSCDGGGGPLGHPKVYINLVRI
jgi:NADH dehydrogenase (ubiquinone) Fe-S protein 6